MRHKWNADLDPSCPSLLHSFIRAVPAHQVQRKQTKQSSPCFEKPTAARHRALRFWFVLLAHVSRCRCYCGLIITLALSWRLPLDSNTLLQRKKVTKSQVPSRILSLFTAATTLGAIWFLNSLMFYEFVNLFNKYLLSIHCLYRIIFLTL